MKTKTNEWNKAKNKQIWDLLQECVFECGCCTDDEKALGLINSFLAESRHQALDDAANIADIWLDYGAKEEILNLKNK